MNEPILTPSHFFKYTTQPLWIWYDLFGDQTQKEEISEFTLKLMEKGMIHEDDYIADLEVTKVEALETDEAIRATTEFMRRGEKLIYQGTIQTEIDGVIYRGRPDLLERREGESLFGNWYYTPIEIKWSTKIKPLHKHQLVFYSIMLETFQGYFPRQVGVISRHHEHLGLTIKDRDIAKAYDLIKKVIQILKGDKPEVMITSKSKESPWYKVALKEAEEKQDISLIYRLDSRSVVGLRKEGIRTLKDLVRTDVSKLNIPYATFENLDHAKLQAKALLEKRVIPLEKLEEIPETPLKLFFDIEGDPLLNIDYLFGFWVTGDVEKRYGRAQNIRYDHEGKYFVYFLAKTPEEEGLMWREFLEWTQCLPETFTVYHYANYEKIHVKNLAAEYGESAALKRFQSKLVDLFPIVKKTAIFPLYFYSIKDIAKSSFLNFKWRHEKAGGGQSIFWYEKWLEMGDEEILNDIVNYNEDDVRATECLFLWLKTF